MTVTRERMMREHFTRLAQESDASIDLARGALLIAAEDDPTIDIDAHLATLETMSRELATRVGDGRAPQEALAILADYLHRDIGLTGDEKTYYDPKNSFLSEVLVRKKGIPISLSVIYIAVGRGAGLNLAGVSFPAHFLVGAYKDQRATLIPDWFIDPFRPHILLTADDCRELFIKLGGSAQAFRQTMLKAVSPRQILTRMLTNLKMIYAQTQHPEKAIAAIDRLLLLNPQATSEYRDRGALHMHLDLYSLALADFERYLSDEPTAAERDTIEQAVATLRARIAMLH